VVGQVLLVVGPQIIDRLHRVPQTDRSHHGVLARRGAARQIQVRPCIPKQEVCDLMALALITARRMLFSSW
jgi:hypothetical protein